IGQPYIYNLKNKKKSDLFISISHSENYALAVFLISILPKTLGSFSIFVYNSFAAISPAKYS
ncbi:unnamed protein product, partial [marine sediment metagenome]